MWAQSCVSRAVRSPLPSSSTPITAPTSPNPATCLLQRTNRRPTAAPISVRLLDYDRDATRKLAAALLFRRGGDYGHALAVSEAMTETQRHRADRRRCPGNWPARCRAPRVRAGRLHLRVRLRLRRHAGIPSPPDADLSRAAAHRRQRLRYASIGQRIRPDRCIRAGRCSIGAAVFGAGRTSTPQWPNTP